MYFQLYKLFPLKSNSFFARGNFCLLLMLILIWIQTVWHCDSAPERNFERLILKLEDLKVLRRSPDRFDNVKIGQGQL